MRQMQGKQHQIGRFIPGVARAVAENQLGFGKTADRKAQEIAHSVEVVLGFFKHEGSHREVEKEWLVFYPIVTVCTGFALV